jgi:hypothetical protein
MEIHLRSLLFVVASLLGSLLLPFVVDAVPGDAQPAAVQALPTPTPVPLRGLSAAAQEMALLAPTPTLTPTSLPRSFAVVATNGANLNLRGAPGLDAPIVGSAAPGDRFPILAASDDGAWLQVERAGGEAVWVYAELVREEVASR